MLFFERGKIAEADERKEEYSHGWHNIRNQIDTFLLRPTTDKHKQVRVCSLRDTGPLLRLPLKFRSLRLCCLIDRDILRRNWFCVQRLDMTGVRIRQGIDVLESPEGGVTSPGTFPVLIRHRRHRRSFDGPK